MTPGPVEQRTPVPDIGAELTADPVVETVETDFGMRILGVGGTGVVTVSQILATAAVLNGNFARSLDQTGLAQKGGAVISRPQVQAAPFEHGSKIGRAGATCTSACDSLVGTDPANLKVATPIDHRRRLYHRDPDGADDRRHLGPLPCAERDSIRHGHGHPTCGLPRSCAIVSRELFADEQYTNMLRSEPHSRPECSPSPRRNRTDHRPQRRQRSTRTCKRSGAVARPSPTLKRSPRPSTAPDGLCTPRPLRRRRRGR